VQSLSPPKSLEKFGQRNRREQVSQGGEHRVTFSLRALFVTGSPTECITNLAVPGVSRPLRAALHIRLLRGYSVASTNASRYPAIKRRRFVMRTEMDEAADAS